MFWVCFTALGIVDPVMLPPGEMFDRSFFVDIVLDSLKKKPTHIPDPNQQKGHLCIWIMPDRIGPIMKFKQITSPGCSIQGTAQSWPRLTLGFLSI
jgi:hypothetical protein